MTDDTERNNTRELNRIYTKLGIMEVEMDDFKVIKNRLMSLIVIFVIQLCGFAYGYGAMVNQQENTRELVIALGVDRYFKSEAIRFENEIRRDLTRHSQQIKALEEQNK